MANFYLAFEVIFPLLAYIMIGFAAARMNLWDEDTALTMNKMVFSIFMPALLFENVRIIDLAAGINYSLILYGTVSTLITFIVLCTLIPRLEKEDSRRGVMIQGIFRSNFILFGLAVARSLWGQEELGDTAILIAVMIPLFNVLAVLALEIFRGGKVYWPRILRNLVTNPLIISSLLGLAVLYSGIRLPAFITTTTSNLGKVATPLALAALGGCFRFEAVKSCLRPLVITVAARLVIMPVIWLTIAVFLGFRGLALISLLPFYGAPTAVASYTMAQQMEGDCELAGQIVVYTSILSIFTIFGFIVIFKSLALF
ncbi:MAG: AEC family transporter [Clostridiales bacterium]